MKWEYLKKCLNIVDEKNIDYTPVEIEGITQDSRNVEENSIFVAINGFLADGHDYISNAIERGAKIVIVEQFTDDSIYQVKVKNSRIALAELANCYYDYPSKKLKVIGITATNGKTSTAFMIESILKKAGFKVGIIGTVEVKYDDVIIPSLLTTPESIDLQRYFADMVERDVEVVIMEVSSSAQDLYRDYGVNYDIISFHNLSKEHIEQHGSFENYFEAKSKIVRNANPDARIILNFDDPLLRKLAQETKGEVFSLGLEDDWDIGAEDIDLSKGTASYTYRYFKDTLTIELGVAGFHSILNSLVAITMGKLLTIDDRILQEGLKNFTGVERRFEIIYNKDIIILDDHFANPKNIEITMKTLEEMVYKNLYIDYAIRGNRGLELNQENTTEFAYWIKKLNPKKIVATKSIETVTTKDAVSDEEERVFCEVMKQYEISVPLYERLDESIFAILPDLKPGDLLLLAGCQGMDHGAKYVWQYFIEKGSPENQDLLKMKIENRIC